MTKHALASLDQVQNILQVLRTSPGEHAWAIQDLTTWSERSKFYWSGKTDNADFAYLLLSGHPGAENAVVAFGNPDTVRELGRRYLPSDKFVVRETPASLTSVFRELLPTAIIYPEFRMEVSRESFKPKHQGKARKLTEQDAEALAIFHGAPPQAARGFVNWIRGAAAIYGIFDNSQLVSMGSTMVSTPEASVLVSIATKEEYRNRGLATELSSALTDFVLKGSKLACTTVVSDNVAAIATYAKLGYLRREDRIWVDQGTGAKP